MPSSNISDWEPIESESDWEPVESGGDWEPISPRAEQKASLKAQQQAIADQGETSYLRGLDAELADRIGQFKKGLVGVVPAALKTASTILSQPNYESQMMTEGAVAPKPQVIPEAQPLFQLGEMAQERINETWPEPENRDLWHDVARGGGQVSQMVGGGAILKGLGASTALANAAAIGSGAVQEFDDAFSRSRLRGDDPDTALAKSLGYSTVAAMIESRLGAGRLLRQLYPSAKEAVKALTAAGVTKKLIGNFVAGGLEEGSQRVAQNWIVEGEPSMEGVVEEAVPGAIVQGIVGAPGAAVTSGQSPTAEFLRRAGAPATAAVAEEINLPLLSAEDIGDNPPISRTIEAIPLSSTEAGLWEAIPEGPQAADIRILAQPSAPRLTPEAAEAGLRETLPVDETTDVRKAPTVIEQPTVKETSVIESGKPVSMEGFHASDKPLKGDVYEGAWFAVDKEATEFYWSGEEFGTRVKANVKFENPLVVSYEQFRDTGSHGPTWWLNKAKKEGHDGVIIQDIVDGDTQTTVFAKVPGKGKPPIELEREGVGKPLNPGGALKDLSSELQAKSNAVKEQMRAEFEALKKKEAEKPTPLLTPASEKVQGGGVKGEDIKPGDKIDWNPNESEKRYYSPISGIVADVVPGSSGGFRVDILAPLPGDPSRIVSVWDNRGRITRTQGADIRTERSEVSKEIGIEKPSLGVPHEKVTPRGGVRFEMAERASRTALLSSMNDAIAKSDPQKAYDPEALIRVEGSKIDAVRDYLISEYNKVVKKQPTPVETAAKKGEVEFLKPAKVAPKNTRDWPKPTKDGYEVVFKPYGEQGRGFYQQPAKPEAKITTRVKLAGSPQTYTVLETLAQTEVEKSNGEQPMRIKNERTGKEEVVLQSEIMEVKTPTEGAKPKRTKADLNKALREAGLDPSVFPDAKSKKSALERAIAKIEEAQKKLRGSRSTLSMGVPKAALDLILEAARLSLKAGNGIAKALEAAMAKARELLGSNFNEDELRTQITDELTKSERKETQSTTMTGEYETSSRSRQVITAEKFSEGKTPEQVIREVALFNAGESVEGLSRENVKATLALAMENLFKIVADSQNPIEANSAANLIGRAQSLFQQQSSLAGQELESAKVARERLGFMAPWLAFRGLAKKAWAKALNVKTEDPESDVTNVVTDSGKKATEEVSSTPTTLKVDEALMKAIRDSGIKLSTLFLDNDHATQSARRKHLFSEIRKAFPNLTTDQKLALEKALMDAWEKARLKIFRQQFKKFVGLPEVAKDNIMDAVRPELIRQANLGTLDDEAFRAAVAKKLGLPMMDGATAKRMIQLAQEAQAAPEGVLRNKVTQKMVDELHKLNQFHPFDIARDYWYANALSGTRTWVAVLSSMAHGVTLASQRAAELALRGNPKAAAQLSWAYLLDVGEGIANAWDVIESGDYTRRAEFGQNIDALLRGKGRLDTLEGMKKHGDAIWKKAIGQTAYARRIIIGLDYISAIATRGSEIIYGSALQKDSEQLEFALRRFNREASKQAKTQAQAELGPGAKWVDVRARQLEILNEGVAQATVDQATLMGEIVALNAPLIGATGAIHEIFKSFPKAIQAAKIPGTQKSADALAFALSTVIGSPFIRATLNMVANASNYMPLIGGLNWARSNMNVEKTPGYLKWLALVDNEGKPLSPQRRNSILAAQLYGIAMTGAAYLLARAGDDDEDKAKRKFDITGTWKGMSPEERKARMAKGERSLSMVINGRYISYATQPMAGALVVAGNMRDKDREAGTSDPEAGMSKIYEAMISGPAYIKDLSTLSGLSAMAGWGAMRTDDATWFNRIMAAQGRNVATAVVPFASLVREADTWFDPQVYRPKEPLHYWIANIPWMRASAAHGPEYNMAGIPVENYLTPQSRLIAKQPNDPLVLALGQLIENGVTPKYPSTGAWIKDGEQFTPTQQGKLTYRHQVETLKKWREIMLPMKDEIAKMTKEEYEEFYKKELLPEAQRIHGELQMELDPDVLVFKRGKYEKSPTYEMKEKK